MSAITDLQSSANTFAAQVSQPPIQITGVVDQPTIDLVQAALNYIANQPSMSAEATTASSLASLATAQQLTTSASGYSTFLDQQANKLGLPLWFAPLDFRRITTMPSWLLWVGGIALVGVTFYTYNKYKAETKEVV